MKFRVTMRDRDALDEAILDALNAAPVPRTISYEEQDEKARLLCKKWFDCDETLTVEIDTDAGTIAVLEVAQ